MARWAGKIGFSIQEETLTNGQPSGIWVDKIIERPYKGDLIKAHRSLNNNNQINDSINISNQISFIGDAYIRNNFQYIRYATFMGVKWKIESIDIEQPRLIVTLGGAYNG